MKNNIKFLSAILTMFILIFTFSEGVSQTTILKDSTNCNRGGRIGVTIGLGISSGAHLGVNYKIFPSLSSELKIGYFEFWNEQYSIFSSGINYHFYRKSNGSLLLNLTTANIHEHGKIYGNNDRNNTIISGSVGFEEFINDKSTFLFRIGYANLFEDDGSSDGGLELHLGLNIYFN